MKKLMILFAIAVMSFFVVSCEEDEIEPVEEFTSSWYQLTVFTDDEKIDYCRFTVHCDPPRENITDRQMVKRDGKFEFKFSLLLDTYGDQLIKVSLYATNFNVTPGIVYRDYQIVEVEGNANDNPHQIIFEVGD